MKMYNVHIYREMRLDFVGIEANTPEAAAAIVRDKPTADADNIDDCEGENLGALVDLAGDDDYSHSVLIDFEGERQRKAAARLLAALEAFVEADTLAEECGEWKWENLEDAFTLARAGIAEAKAAGIAPAPASIDVHALLAERRQIAAIWSIEDVQEVRPGLSDDQAWQVLKQAEKYHDGEYGITWDTLRMHADDLPGDAPTPTKRKP
jgi:hypothetical protein